MWIISVISVGLTIATPLVQNYPPREWKEYRFGLSVDRWETLKGKAIWVTGAGTGYGRCIAIALAAAGSFVILSGRRKEKLVETIEVMKSYGIENNSCEIVDFDLKDSKKIEEACQTVKRLTQYLYGLVNNAALPQGRDIPYPLQEGTYELWDNIMKTNLTAPWYLTKTILPHMIKGKEVRVVFMTSEAGWAFTPGFGMYNVSKAALNNLAASFAAETSESNSDVDIQMNVLVPGEARTEMNQSSSISPFTIIPMTLALLSHPPGGPNGRFFHRDGRHSSFCYVLPYEACVL
jgi:NAD(P)-dependent dehydrogenase (short-subunit alcohol dehydrogenase family)